MYTINTWLFTSGSCQSTRLNKGQACLDKCYRSMVSSRVFAFYNTPSSFSFSCGFTSLSSLFSYELSDTAFLSWYLNTGIQRG